MIKIKLDAVLAARGLSGYRFAREYLGQQPNSLTPIRKEGYDPKLSTLVKWSSLLECDISELFEVQEVVPTRKPQKTFR